MGTRAWTGLSQLCFVLAVACAGGLPGTPGGSAGFSDMDGDGIPTSRDKCPSQPEDVDGFEDDDGCLDADNDRDGIDDANDVCPNEPETINGSQDDDGCPDEIPAAGGEGGAEGAPDPEGEGGMAVTHPAPPPEPPPRPPAAPRPGPSHETSLPPPRPSSPAASTVPLDDARPRKNPYSPDLVDEVRKLLTRAVAAFNPPETLFFYESYELSLVLSPKVPVEELVEHLPHQPNARPTKPTTADVLVSNRMKATLKGEAFEIESLTPEEQAVSSGVTKWSWMLRPTELGPDKKLTLNLHALIDVAGKETQDVRTLERDIYVRVSAYGLMKYYKSILAGAIVSALFGLGVWRLKKRWDSE